MTSRKLRTVDEQIQLHKDPDFAPWSDHHSDRDFGDEQMEKVFNQFCEWCNKREEVELMPEGEWRYNPEIGREEWWGTSMLLEERAESCRGQE